MSAKFMITRPFCAKILNIKISFTYQYSTSTETFSEAICEIYWLPKEYNHLYSPIVRQHTTGMLSPR